MTSSLQEIVLTSSPDGAIVAYDISTGSSLAHFNGSRSPRKGLALIGKTHIAASHVSSDTGLGSIHFYNWWSSIAFHHLPMPEPVAPLVATQDGMFLFAGGVSGNLYSISLSHSSADVIQSFPAHNKPITCLEINDDGSLIFSGSDDGTIMVLPVHQLVDSFSCWENSIDKYSAIVQRFVGHEASITAITIGIGGWNGTIISCSIDCTCKFWSLECNTPLYSIQLHCTMWGVAMDPLESELFLAGSDGMVYKGALKVRSRQSLGKGIEINTWKKHPGSGPITAMVTTNWGQNLVTASEDGNVCIWDVERGDLIKVIEQKEKGSISHLLVSKGLKDDVRLREKTSNYDELRSISSCCFGKEEFLRPVKELIEMEKKLEVAQKGRKRAVHTLELAIDGYERFLKLIHREAKAGCNIHQA